MNEKSTRKLLAIGLDGGDLAIIREHIQHLPTLHSLLESGCLYEPAAPKALSGSVWPTFYNGCDPGHHGIYQHLVWDSKRMGIRRIAPDWCYYKPFWKTLEQQGLKVAVFDVPYSFPGQLNEGLEIMDWGTHGQTWALACNDPEVSGWLGKCVIGRETPVKKTQGQLKKIGASLQTSAKKKGQVIKRIMAERNLDVLLAVFGETHRGGHTLFGAEDNLLRDVYVAVDEAIGNVLQAKPEDTALLLFSVHGMERDQAQGHLVRPLINRINALFMARHMGAAETARKFRAIGLLRQFVPDRLQHAVGAAATDAIRQWVVEREMVGGLDLSRTPAIALRTDIRTEVRLNLKGRERQGLLEPGSELLNRYLALFKKTFLELKSVETNEGLVDQIVETQALYEGENEDRLPDLVITWRPQPPAKEVFSPAVGKVSARIPEVRGGDHTDFGFAIVSEAETADLPPLEYTRDFASVISCLAGTDHLPERTARRLSR